MLSVSENWRWDEVRNEFIDFRENPPVRHPATSFEAKVAVYESRVREWFLDVAQAMVANGKAREDYVALSIGLAYIEGVEQYRRGKITPRGKSGDWFKRSTKQIFSNVSEEALKRLWEEVRCGLFHSGFTDGCTYLSHSYAQAIAINQGNLQINPARFIETVISDFSSYVSKLRDSNNLILRQNFITLWDQRWEHS